MADNTTPHSLTVNGHMAWQALADAQLLAIQGNWFIAQDLAKRIRGLWHHLVRLLDVGQHWNVPPV